MRLKGESKRNRKGNEGKLGPAGQQHMDNYSDIGLRISVDWTDTIIASPCSRRRNGYTDRFVRRAVV